MGLDLVDALDDLLAFSGINVMVIEIITIK
jgi:hypothetical protein